MIRSNPGRDDSQSSPLFAYPITHELAYVLATIGRVVARIFCNHSASPQVTGRRKSWRTYFLEAVILGVTEKDGKALNNGLDRPSLDANPGEDDSRGKVTYRGNDPPQTARSADLHHSPVDPEPVLSSRSAR